MGRTLIKSVDAITLEAGCLLASDVDIAIEDGVIVGVGQGPADFDADEVVDGADHVAFPGLFNAHCHSPMTLERGWAEDLPFERWLNEKIWVAESALEQEDVYWGAALAACEMVRSGTVGFADHYFWMDQVARVVEESGLRALLAWCWFGLSPDREVGGTTFDTTLGFARRWHGAAEGRIRVALGPHSPYMCSDAALEQVADAAAQLGLPVHLHVAESQEQVRTSLHKHGATPVQRLASLGVLRGPVLAAHCLAVGDEDVEILADHKVTVAHTPKTYMKLGMDRAPLRLLIDAGVSVALGTDGPASNSDLNLLEVLRLVAQQQKQEAADAAVFPKMDILEMGSTAGARAMGFASSGRLVAGADADLVLMRMKAPHWFPRHDPAASVVYGSHPSDVRHVMVAGRWLMRDGELLTLDEEKIRHEAERRAFRMVGQEMRRLRRYGA